MEITANSVQVRRDCIRVGVTIKSKTWLKFASVDVPYEREWLRLLVTEMGRERPPVSEEESTIPLF